MIGGIESYFFTFSIRMTKIIFLLLKKLKSHITQTIRQKMQLITKGAS
jgi:hypothetical protein